ncbi:MAG: D-glycero-beta-D-manno-heptose 1-phosphate adenylyltransferase [Bacteroidales bacterium]|nr:D-glycero-beta-D-manno-heptose 1-phosphate adenylyltransferase [Bacteroidales bacterium]
MPKLAVIQEKILSGDRLNRWLAVSRFKGRKIVFTNGCFDVLHRGHITYLAKAASLGNALLIGLNTDASVKRLKGADRPLQDEDTRALVLASLGFVTAVVLFDEDTPYDLIKKIQPDVLVKGGEYKVEEIVGYDVVKGKGGTVLTIDMVEGFSSTGIIRKMKGRS